LGSSAVGHLRYQHLRFRSELGGIPLRLLNMARDGVIRLDVSDAIFEELADVLETKFHWRKPDIEHAIVQLRAFANHVTPSESLKVVRRDPDDDTILECAAAARSDYVVTGDKDLLEVGLHRGARIIMPAVFLALGRSH
jgi:putative PIN family toxin of toxin-antitoxin system